jgi:hypothetical protein
VSDSGRDWGASSDDSIRKFNALKRESKMKHAVEQLDELHAATTQGEWHVVHTDDEMRMSAIYVGTKNRGDRHDNQIGMDGRRSGEIVAATLIQHPIRLCHESEQWDEDAEFIATIHNAWPIISDELKRLRDTNEMLVGALKIASADCDQLRASLLLARANAKQE